MPLMLVDHYFHHSFPFSIFFCFFPSPLQPCLIEGLIGSKYLFSESVQEYTKSCGYNPFLTPLAIVACPGSHCLTAKSYIKDLSTFSTISGSRNHTISTVSASRFVLGPQGLYEQCCAWVSAWVSAWVRG